MISDNLKKIWRFYTIYGLLRTIIKVSGRLRFNFPVSLFLSPLKYFSSEKDIVMVGAGQFAYATIGFFIVKGYGNRFKACYDVDSKNLTSFSKAYSVPKPYLVTKPLISNFDGIRLAYIASNHSTHTEYAIQFLSKDIDVYIEKPIAVSIQQLNNLINSSKQSKGKVYCGYNRPFAKAITELKSLMDDGSFTMTCSVIGHFIEEGHWYRNPEEGTRVCGNLGHWIDLSVHLLQRKGGFSLLNIQVNYADLKNTDDNICVSITSDRGDLISLVLTARDEPFEGINETIVFQQGALFSKIDDFRKAEFQIGSKKIARRYRPKDVGHEKAIMQPFNSEARDINEVFLSTKIMLHIMDMVKSMQQNSTYHVSN